LAVYGEHKTEQCRANRKLYFVSRLFTYSCCSSYASTNKTYFFM